MAMEARNYQHKALVDLRSAIQKYQSVVFRLPTGGGKTVVAGMIAQGVIRKQGQIMFVVHRRELVKQALDTLTEAVPGLSVGVEAPGWPSMPWAPLQIGMVQSMVRRDYVAKMKPSVIIWDEAHHVRASTWEKALDWWPDTPRIGLTATPERLDGKGLGAHFAAMVHGPEIHELVAEGYLAPCKTLTVPVQIDLEGLRRNRNGEYGKGMAERITDRVVADAADAYCRYAPGRQAIFFGEDRNHSRRVMARLQNLGVKAAHVDGDDHPARRDRIMTEFRGGTIQVVGNCDLISEGFDAPACDAVILGKFTSSVTRYLQASGRAMRPRLGKEALILDLVGISHELGLPDEPREWSLEDGEIGKRREGKAKPRECPECRAMHYGPRCPHCQHQEPLVEVEETKVELVEAQRRGKAKGRRSDVWRELAIAKKQPDVKAAVESIARRRGYKPGWAKHILRAWGIT